MKPHNIGGSILPSSSQQVLSPMPFRGGTLQVVADYEADTHRLAFNGKVLASHANGHSLRALAERMKAGAVNMALDQAQYIVDCGGQSDFEAIASAMEGYGL